MIRINDTLFGELNYEKNYWSGKTNIQIFNINMEIVLSVDGHETADFSNIQRESFRNFQKDMENIMDKVEQQIYKYYCDNFEEYREMLENETEADKLVPKIDSVTNLKKLVKPKQLIVRRTRKNGKRRLGLLCDVTWDMENGLGVKIEDESVEEVGYQDIVL
ncbi:DUF6985 domain-containing protein [Sporolactobacillus laevolacticus]|jgi:hypothetical protein|uniref:DUF6985 domain-containing protein n=1 Tax=Sporolactobacillus laevolacticus TaxID=33018 RepID=UPI0025B48530|nr:hypothetical protein [Sporolactobacillus laevolacticus]MDN3955971.1 hypothetical protein [Sporolactobacillus laevolacticus]